MGRTNPKIKYLLKLDCEITESIYLSDNDWKEQCSEHKTEDESVYSDATVVSYKGLVDIM
jgi:hypothetical protein